MATPVGKVPKENPAIPYLYMYLYKQRKGKKHLSSHSKRAKK